MGFVLQLAGLRRTPHANAVAARAATVLLRYGFATSTLRLGDRVVHGRCFHGWIEGHNERPARGTILVLDNGASVRTLDPNTLGRPALAVHFERFTLLVSARTDRPLGVTLGGVASTIRLSPLTPVAAQALRQGE